MRAIGHSSGRSSRTSSVTVASTGASIAVPETSPSPCAACPSPAEKSAPSTGIGRKSVVPATSSLQSMLPPQRRGGIVECTPGSSGGIPSTPRNGASRTVRPSARPIPSASSQSIRCRRLAERHAPRPRRRPRRSARRASGRRGRRAPRSARRARGRCRAPGSRDANGSSRPTRQPAFGTENRTESPGSIVEHRLELAREVPVQDGRVERELVLRH